MCLDDSCNSEASSRRDFLVGATAAIAGLTILGGDQAASQGVQPPTRVLDDPSIQHGKVVFKHGGIETIDGFLARPKAEGRYPPVLVVAGNRITEEYIPNTCAALAVAGFIGLAPNVFHPLPDSARSPDEMRTALAGHTDLDVLGDVQAGADYLRGQPYVKPGPLGIVGFCFGGRIAMLYGARSRR